MDPRLLPVMLVFIAIVILVVWIGFAVVRVQKTAAERLAVYGRTSTNRDQVLDQPFVERALAPVILSLGRVANRFTPIGYLENVQKRLIYGGNPGNVDATSLVLVKVILFIAGVIVAWFLRDVGDGLLKTLTIFGPPLLGFFGPDAWLQRHIDDRKSSMQKALPDTLDLLVISVEAGLGFDSALARVVQTVPGPLSEEFFRMLQETRVGVSRRDAMRHLMDRTDIDELRSFLLAMMQAEAFGVTIARVLRVQADEMRVKRRQRAQEKAFAAPVKLVFPLVFCIFPSLFIVLLGPAAIRIADAFSGI
ncbi:MAG: type II secretion system F family protein [Acidimicrobiia bacterium]